MGAAGHRPRSWRPAGGRRPGPGGGRPVVGAATTDKDGRFEVRGLWRGRFLVLADAPGRHPADWLELDLREGEPGVVGDLEPRLAVAREVRFRWAGDLPEGDVPILLVVPEDWAAGLEELRAGVVRHQGPCPVALPLDGTGPVGIELARDITWRARLILAGRTLAETRFGPETGEVGLTIP